MALSSWLADSLIRHFPSTAPRKASALGVDIARNEPFSFQLALHNAPPAGDDIPMDVAVSAGVPRGWQVRIRRIGYVPVLHHNTNTPRNELDGAGLIPGYVGDPLLDFDGTIALPAGETHALWFTVTPRGRAIGRQDIVVTVSASGRSRKHRLTVNRYDVTVRPRRDFHVTNWFYNDAILDFHNCQTFDRRYWRILPNYMTNLADHGQDTIYTPVFTPPLDGVKRPNQLLRVARTGPDSYTFDWRDVKRYVNLAQRCGLKRFEWTHLFTQWGVKHAIAVYENQGADEKRLWGPNTGATSATYRKFLAQFLPSFKRFLLREGLMGKSFFHVSDEPHAEHLAQYGRARALLAELAPWMRVMDALSDISFARSGLTDMPIPSIRTALDFADEGIDSWCYYCCGPRGKYVNRLIDTPLAKIRMNGWLFYRRPFKGFLHWGYNYWYKSQTRTPIDPYQVQDGQRWPGWAYGDCFMVYPGQDGPVDSVRWEVFADSLRDYALLQSLGVDRDSKLLAELKSFQDFPKTADWVHATRRKLLRAASK